MRLTLLCVVCLVIRTVPGQFLRGSTSAPTATEPNRAMTARQPRNFLTIIATFKNEAHILQEWVQHYKQQGVEYFFLVNNNSSDTYAKVLQPYVESGLVKMVSTDRKHYQVAAYNDLFPFHIKFRSRWVLVVDLDEFMYSTEPNGTIASTIHNLEQQDASGNLAQICVPWKMFGSSNYTQQPRCVVQSFQWRQAAPGASFTKCAARTDRVKHLDIHRHIVDGRSICADGSEVHGASVHVRGCSVQPGSERASRLHLNHYPLQARDFFEAVKVSRGDAARPETDSVRTSSYFAAYNQFSNDVVDTELAALQHRYAESQCRNTSDARRPVGHALVVQQV